MNQRSDSRVLIVEDDPSERMLLQRALARLKISSDWAADGVDADKLLAKKRYDVVLSDLRMPRKHGHKLIVEILSRPSPPAVIATTGVVEYKILADLYERGVEDVLIKPFNVNILAMRVQALLAKASTRQSPDQTTGVTSDIERTSNALKQQLSALQGSFNETIEHLERQRDELEEGYIGSVRVLTGLMDQLGKIEGSHSGRVEKLAVSMGMELHVDRRGLQALRMASLLHELGKIGLPDAVRDKAPWQLTEEEMRINQQYPLIGATLLSEIHGVETVVEVISTHAENFDGTGYPAGLSGAQIPLLGRILRLADGLDTFSMHYGCGDKIDALVAHLAEHRGKWYDPDLVSLAIAHVPVEYQVEERQVRSIGIGHVEAGSVLADNVYDDEGRFLARKGAVLTPSLLGNLALWLKAREIRIYVPDEKPK